MVVVRRAFEHQMLEEMGETGVSGLLVLRADVIPDVDGDDRTVVILVEEHVEAVRERVPRKGKLHRKLPQAGADDPVIGICDAVPFLQPLLPGRLARRDLHTFGRRQMQAVHVGDDRVAQRAELLARIGQLGRAESCSAGRVDLEGGRSERRRRRRDVAGVGLHARRRCR